MKKHLWTLLILFNAAFCFAGSLVVESEIDSLWIQAGNAQAPKRLEINSARYKASEGGKLVIGVWLKEDSKTRSIQIADLDKKTNGTNHVQGVNAETNERIELVYELYTEPCGPEPFICFTQEKFDKIYIKITDFLIDGKSITESSIRKWFRSVKKSFKESTAEDGMLGALKKKAKKAWDKVF